MKALMEDFNRFINEQTDLPDFRFEAVCVNRSTKERGKEDVLNDIRSLPGVTIVAVREADKPRSGEDYSLLSIKVDRFILGHRSVKTIMRGLAARIRRMEGVISFAVKGVPEQL